ncbi:MAG: tetratricopeptide repeat protein [Gammaproteobacteria bacterium]|nr:tetratricopeptide repeat protein [Gammaproteobacteria bacterium]
MSNEQEDLETLKSWWKNYGNATIFGVILGVAILVGFRYWSQHKEERLQSASVLYEQLLKEFRAQNVEAIRKTGESLVNDYSSTPYAGMAGLLLARLDYIVSDVAAATKHLQWVIDHAKDGATVHAARLRLARIYMDKGDKDKALALLNVTDQAGFEAEYAEAKGDIYLAQGKPNEARSAYRDALKNLPTASPYIPVLNMKLDDLGPEKTS